MQTVNFTKHDEMDRYVGQCVKVAAKTIAALSAVPEPNEDETTALRHAWSIISDANRYTTAAALYDQGDSSALFTMFLMHSHMALNPLVEHL